MGGKTRVRITAREAGVVLADSNEEVKLVGIENFIRYIKYRWNLHESLQAGRQCP